MPPELVKSLIQDIEKARDFALLVHGDQKYAGIFPYGHHLQGVVNVLKRFRKDTVDLEQAAWLHDVLEDTATKLSDLYGAGFSSEVCSLVVAVTNEPGPNRKARHLKTWPKIRYAGANAVILKVADRIANTEFSFLGGGSMLGMYRKEFPAFYEALYRPDECDDMWVHLREISSRPEAA